MKKIIPVLLFLVLLTSCTQTQPKYVPVVTTKPQPAVVRAETNALQHATERTPEAVEGTAPVPFAHSNVVAEATPPEKATAGQTNAVPSPFARPAQPAIPAQAPPVAATPADHEVANAAAETPLPALSINFQGVPVDKVLQVYAEYVGRTLLRSPSINAQTLITLVQTTPLTKTEIIHALDAELAMNNIAMIPIGDKFIKVVPLAEAGQQGEKIEEMNASMLPEFGPFKTRVVQLKYLKPSDLVPILQQFTKTPAAILPIEGAQMLVLRDSSENVQRMVEVINMLDTATPQEIESEVIPIKYALASDIANALNSLSGGGGGATVGGGGGGTKGSLGTSHTTGMGNTRTLGAPYGGTATPQGGIAPGTTAPGGVGGAASQSFSERVRNLVQQASASAGGKGEFQILGQTKIIADERMNALLVFANHDDMQMVKKVVKQLDVVLPQVLIEAIIMEVTLDSSKNLGVSFAQHPMGNNNATAGGYNNGQQFFPFTPSQISGSNAFPGNFTSVLPANQFSYWANFNGNYDLAVQAAENDSRVNVLSRPRIQTSHGVEADLFVGETIPYVDSTTAGAFGGTGVYNSYQQQQIGITLKVKPLINPDGLVVMDIYQEASEPGPQSTAVNINGTSVPTINQRQAAATVAVKDRDTIILGGMIGTTITKTVSGVPYLMNIPMLGKLFQSTANSTARTELIVLLRPTVLPTPEAAATVATAERRSMAGVRRAEAEIRADEAASMKHAEEEIHYLTNGVAPSEY
jgi:general secretion pathway protein D